MNRPVTILQRVGLEDYAPFLLVYNKAAGDTTQNPDENEPVSDSDRVFVNAVGDTRVAPSADKAASSKKDGGKVEDWEVAHKGSDGEKKESPKRVNTGGNTPGTPVANTVSTLTFNTEGCAYWRLTTSRRLQTQERRENEYVKAAGDTIGGELLDMEVHPDITFRRDLEESRSLGEEGEKPDLDARPEKKVLSPFLDACYPE